MPIRLRKFIGTILLLILVAIWSLLAMAVAQLPVLAAHFPLQVAFYVLAGLGWILPAMPLVRWMARPLRGTD